VWLMLASTLFSGIMYLYDARRVFADKRI
jgi:hypothetical protein